MSRLLFLSHSGADTEAATELKRRLLASHDALEGGLKVWFDKDDLKPGGQWQPQIEQAIEKDASAFGVYVGSRGIINWVDVEVRTALSRAATDKGFLFIPILAPDIGANALPAFARLYQGVADPLGNADQLAKLLKAALTADWDKAAKLIDEPFVGLRAMREEESDRFFGRGAEIAELTEKFRKHRVVAIVADSGTGKSSLARAGFAPAFRGGALIDLAREEARDKIWQVVTMRPRADPAEGLRQGVETAAQKLGRSLADVAALRDSVSVADVGKTAFALRCGLSTDATSTLLIVDQFEELFTTTPKEDAAAFAALMLALADGPSDLRILLTVRSDYFNLASGVRDASGRPALFERLTADNNDAVLRLKAMSFEGLREAVLEPLKLAGEADETALADAVQTDISHQASDLPLLQVALRAAWLRHRANGRPMLECYQSVGRVSGALANEADAVLKRLPADDQARLESVFVRLVRLGDTGGATRRAAALDEFDAPRRDLLQRLGSAENGSLVAVGATTAEIAHEALITQWPWLAERLNSNADAIRRLGRLTAKAPGWAAAPDSEKAEYLAFGAERQLFSELAEKHPDWLSGTEKDFVAASHKAHLDELAADQREQARKLADARTIVRRTLIGGGVALVLAVAAGAFAWYAQTERGVADAKTAEALKAEAKADIAARLAEAQKNEAEKATKLAAAQSIIAIKESQEARRNASVALTALANVEAQSHPFNAAKLALAAWPRNGADIGKPKLPETVDVLRRLVPYLRQIAALGGDDDSFTSAAFSPDGKHVVTASRDQTAHVWDAETGREIATLKGHSLDVTSAAFSPDGQRIVTASTDGTARVWDAETGREIATLKGPGHLSTAVFSPDGKRVATASDDETARVWDAQTGREIAVLQGHGNPVHSASFSPDGKRVVTSSYDTTARVWDAETGREIATLKGHSFDVTSAAFSPDGKRVVTAGDNTARIWNAETGDEITILKHDTGVHSAVFSPDGKRVATTPEEEKTAHVWDAETGREIATLKGHDDVVRSALFSPDGKRVVTASDDTTARVWDAETGREITFLKHEFTVLSAAFSPDGKRVVTTDGATARVWDVSAGSDGNVVQAACTLIRRHEGLGPISLKDVTDYPLTFDPPTICDTEPPAPDAAKPAP
jgi:WD40 repeat protein